MLTFHESDPAPNELLDGNASRVICQMQECVFFAIEFHWERSLAHGLRLHCLGLHNGYVLILRILRVNEIILMI